MRNLGRLPSAVPAGARIALLVATCGLGTPRAMAADLALPGLPAPFNYDGNGVYFGGHVGYGRGTTDVTLTEPVLSPVQQGFGSLYGGIQAGYNRLFGPHLLLGIETSVSFANAAPSDNVVWIGRGAHKAPSPNIDYRPTPPRR